MNRRPSHLLVWILVIGQLLVGATAWASAGIESCDAAMHADHGGDCDCCPAGDALDSASCLAQCMAIVGAIASAGTEIAAQPKSFLDALLPGRLARLNLPPLDPPPIV